MPSSLSRQDPSQGPADAASRVARPQHHGIFLEPLYTVELPPLSDSDDDGDREPEFFTERSASRRRAPGARRG
ncbi:hypothetical protein [Streptomyces sp. NPDC088725]|uniref:hypothetical protein n=1 Tax=Streptomyces sp. NPDC088725 TaxID=3365873 RepID=UPI0038046D26